MKKPVKIKMIPKEFNRKFSELLTCVLDCPRHLRP